MKLLSPLSSHYIYATTTDFDVKGYVTGYHVARYDLNVLLFAFVAVLFSFIVYDISKRILSKIKKIINKKQ